MHNVFWSAKAWFSELTKNYPESLLAVTEIPKIFHEQGCNVKKLPVKNIPTGSHKL